MTAGRRIFLAHAREDKAQVRKLYADLKARGLDPWLDEVDLMPGQIWKVEIPKAIRQAGMFLACLSSRSVEKVGYVQNEFRQALSAFAERPPESIWLIPVRLDNCAVPDLKIPDLGLSLQDIQWVDLWQEGEFDRLVKSIEQTLMGGTPPPQAVRKEATSASWRPEPVALQPKVAPDRPPALIAPNDTDRFLAQLIDKNTLAEYTNWKYPDLPLNQEIHELLIRDLPHSRFVTLRDVDRAIEAATDAVEEYRKENPGLFKAGTDFVTKSLGFVDRDFRVRHPFSQRTREGFAKYEHLVQPNNQLEANDREDTDGQEALSEPAQERQSEFRWRALRNPIIIAAIIGALGAMAAALISSPLLLSSWPFASPRLPAAVEERRIVRGIMTPAEILQANKDAVVFLHVTGDDANGVPKEALATGFLVSSSGHVITAKHILFDDQGRALIDQYNIVGAVGSRYEPPREMEVRARDPDADVLLLQFRGNRTDYRTVDVCTGVSVEVGADLVTIGFPRDSDLSVVRGVLSNKNGPRGLWQTDLPVMLGYSGAPVFVTDGRVVGSVSGGTADVAGRNFFTPIDDASYVLARLPEPVEQCD